jgi:hypothetical protein
MRNLKNMAEEAKKLKRIRMYAWDKINEFEEIKKALAHSGDILTGYDLGEYETVKKIFKITQESS